jgi:hypothetical protein
MARLCGGMFERNGYTPQQRMRLFYGVCIPIRFLLVAFLLAMAWFYPIPTAWLGLSFGTIIFVMTMYFSVHQGCRWWRPTSGVIVSAAIIAVAIMYLVGGDKYIHPLFIGCIMLAHVVFGLLFSFKQHPW